MFLDLRCGSMKQVVTQVAGVLRSAWPNEMNADELSSRSFGEPRTKSTKYAVDVRSPVPRFRFERNSKGQGDGEGTTDLNDSLSA